MRVYKVTLDVLRSGNGGGWDSETYNVTAENAEIAWSKVNDKPKAYRWEDGDTGKKYVNPVKSVEFGEAEIICELGKEGE